MNESLLVSACFKRTINHFWSSMQSVVFLRIWGHAFTKRYCMLKWLKRKSTTTHKLSRLLANGRPASMIWSWVTYVRCVTTINTLSSKTWWKPVSCFSSETVKYTISWNQSLTHQQSQWIRTTSQLGYSLSVVYSLCKGSLGIWHHSVISVIQKRNATSYSARCTASTSATSRLSPAAARASSRLQNFSKIYFKCTNLRSVIIWIRWESSPWKLLSHGYTSLSWEL